MALATRGWRGALLENRHLLHGLNVCHGKLTLGGLEHLDDVVPALAAVEAAGSHW